MSHRSIIGLGGEAQYDNDPHRLDYIRRDQAGQYPTVHEEPVRDWRIVSIENGARAGAIIGLWLILAVNKWLACHAGVDFYCAVSEPLFALYPLFLFAAAAGYLTWLAVKAWLRTSVEVRRASIVQDAYSNPVGVTTVLDMPLPQYQQMFDARLRAEIAMAPHKQLPAGLDAYSTSYHYSNKQETNEPIDIDALPTIKAVDTWLPWLTDEMVPHLLIIGKNRSGKSTLGDIVLKFRADRGDQIAILDPHWSSQDRYGSKKWGGIPPIARSVDEIVSVLQSLKAEYDDRQRRMKLMPDEPDFRPEMSFDPLTILIDEAPEVVAELKRLGKKDLWGETVKIFGSGGAKVNMNVILLSQSVLVEDVGMNSNMRGNFCIIALANTAIPFIYKAAPKEQRPALLELLKQHTQIGMKPYETPAAAEYGEVIVLSRNGILELREKAIEADVWPGVRCGVELDDEKLLKTLLSHTTPHRTPGQDTTIVQLIALKKSGLSRRDVRRLYPGIVFDDALWSMACKIADEK